MDCVEWGPREVRSGGAVLPNSLELVNQAAVDASLIRVGQDVVAPAPIPKIIMV